MFPESDDMDFETFPRLEPEPKCARGSTYCEKVNGYPYEYMENVLRQHQGYEGFFRKTSDPDELSNRIGESEKIPMCQSVTKIIYPQLAKNKNDKWKFILNRKGGYAQGVRIEKCSR